MRRTCVVWLFGAAVGYYLHGEVTLPVAPPDPLVLPSVNESFTGLDTGALPFSGVYILGPNAEGFSADELAGEFERILAGRSLGFVRVEMNRFPNLFVRVSTQFSGVSSFEVVLGDKATVVRGGQEYLAPVQMWTHRIEGIVDDDQADDLARAALIRLADAVAETVSKTDLYGSR